MVTDYKNLIGALMRCTELWNNAGTRYGLMFVFIKGATSRFES